MIKVLESGILSSIQDLGRKGYLHLGIPISGVMDTYSSNLANALVGNNLQDAVLEMTMIGPKLQFNKETQIVITGAIISPMLNDISIENGKVYTIIKGDILKFGKLKTGLRAYLAVSGGFKTDLIYGSRSYFRPVTPQNTIKKNDILSFGINNNSARVTTFLSKLRAVDFINQTLKVFKGPEYHKLSQNQKDNLFDMDFHISNLYNRMAYQLSTVLVNNLDPIITGPVLPGTVQLTPSGRLIILMRDCQTTGGYPRILQLTESSLNLLSQKKERDKIQFSLVDF